MQKHQIRHLPITNAMVPEPYAVKVDKQLDTLLAIAPRPNMGSFVVTRHGRLANMFTTLDACQVFAEFLRDQFHQPGVGTAA